MRNTPYSFTKLLRVHVVFYLENNSLQTLISKSQKLYFAIANFRNDREFFSLKKNSNKKDNNLQKIIEKIIPTIRTPQKN